MPEISVIVPVYNVEPYIYRCVDSILGQTFTDFELILVDDGSPDNCGVICDEYARKDSRIHVIHQENGGLSAARNSGIDWVFANSDSQWLTFIDSDDWVHRDFLQILITAATQEHTAMAVCDMLRVAEYCEDAMIPSLSVCCMDSDSVYTEHYGMCMAAWRKIFRRNLFENLRFPVGKLHEDCYVTHIPLFEAGKVAVCDVPLYYYFTNPGSITRMRWSEKRLQELEAHECRAAWLKEHGCDKAYRRETEVYVMTIYEHAEVLANLSMEDKVYIPHLKHIQSKLLQELKKAKAMGLYAFEREYLWLYAMSYGGMSVWKVLWKLREILRK